MLTEQTCLSLGIAVTNPKRLLNLKSLRIEPPVRLVSTQFAQHLSIGAFTYMNGGNCICARIGRYCSIAQSVAILQQDHPTGWLSTHPFQYGTLGFLQASDSYIFDGPLKKYKSKIFHSGGGDTVIGNDVWVGHGVCIVNGVSIGDGAIIAAGAVVSKDVAPYSIVGGNPARLIRYRFAPDIISRLETLQWWRFAPWDLAGIDFSNVASALSELERRIELGLKPFSPPAVSIDVLKSINDNGVIPPEFMQLPKTR